MPRPQMATTSLVLVAASDGAMPWAWKPSAQTGTSQVTTWTRTCRYRGGKVRGSWGLHAGARRATGTQRPAGSCAVPFFAAKRGERCSLGMQKPISCDAAAQKGQHRMQAFPRQCSCCHTCLCSW